MTQNCPTIVVSLQFLNRRVTIEKLILMEQKDNETEKYKMNINKLSDCLKPKCFCYVSYDYHVGKMEGMKALGYLHVALPIYATLIE